MTSSGDVTKSHDQISRFLHFRDFSIKIADNSPETLEKAHNPQLKSKVAAENNDLLTGTLILKAYWAAPHVFQMFHFQKFKSAEPY